jgi:hypothetical protein
MNRNFCFTILRRYIMGFLQKGEKYFSKHPSVNAIVHATGGIAVGILLTYPLVGAHPVRWAIAFGVLSLLGHVYAGTHK